MNQANPHRVTISLRHGLVLLLINAVILTALSWPTLQNRVRPLAVNSATPSKTSVPTASLTTTSTETSSPSPSASPTQPSITDPFKTDPSGPFAQGLIILSIREGGYAHLFAYQPVTTPLTRLTNHAWDDINPSISPDGQKVAYSSRQNGYWDLFVLDLSTGKSNRLTDSPEYKGSPSWSPDGQWLAYEDYNANHLEIFIQSVEDPGQAPIPLTSDEASDYSPAWSPQGRLVVYVSNRSGIPEIWLADLDKTDHSKFTKISHNPNAAASHPAWSPDGNHLAWVSTQDGLSSLYLWDRLDPENLPRLIGSGDWPVWSPTGDFLASRTQMPNQSYLTAYQVPSGNVILSPLALPAQMMGIDWKNAALPDPPPASFERAGTVTPTPLWSSQVATVTNAPSGRHSLTEIKDISAPHPLLLDSITPSFISLRTRVANEIGWDYLSSLENAFVPYSDPLSPETNEDWLFTGRSFAANPIPMNAGWMVLIREDYGAETYWRVYLKTRYQDGSQGQPIVQAPWDLNDRYNGDPRIYDQGGTYATSAPSGYWLDFTTLAQAYGWNRLPSQINWRTYYPAIRFNQFVAQDGLDWRSAMLQVYPSEFLTTTTPILPPTPTATLSPSWIRPRTPTPTPTFTATSTRRPTWTPDSP